MHRSTGTFLWKWAYLLRYSLPEVPAFLIIILRRNRLQELFHARNIDDLEQCGPRYEKMAGVVAISL